MIVKIDGVRDPEQIYKITGECEKLPNYLCFDFRRNSPNYMGEVDEAIYSKIPLKIRKTGIFQDDTPLYILSMAGRFMLSAVQLEGNESKIECEILAAEGVEVIKAINNAQQIEKYEGICNKFIIRDHKILKTYTGQTPIITSWGLNHKKGYGVEVKHNEIKGEEWINFFKQY